MPWMNNLRIAIIEEDIVKIGSLINEAPSYHDIPTAQETLALITQALLIVKQAKHDTFTTMQKIKQTKAFLLSDEVKTPRFIG